MDNQTPPTKPAVSNESPSGLRPEDLQSPVGVEPLRVEPTPGNNPNPAPTAQPPKLTSQDVQAALAAVPGGGTSPAVTSTPATAGDIDVIEPEWVAKAEAEVLKHAGDPYGEEEAVEDLQQDYLKKRYNYEVADPNADGKT